jgi:hypothetical protein
VHIGINNVDAVFVGERGVGSFPGCDATTTVTECDGGLFDPGGTKTVEEVGFTSHFAIFEVGVAELADVYLQNM